MRTKLSIAVVLAAVLALVAVSGAWPATEYPRVREPIPVSSERAFADDPYAAQSRAALLLGLGALLCVGNRSAECADLKPAELVPAEDLERLGLPPSLLGLADQKPERFGIGSLREQLSGLAAGKAPADLKPEEVLGMEARAYRRLSDGWQRRDAALAILVGLEDPDPLVQVAAACSLPHATEDAGARELTVPRLARAAASGDDLLREVAATCLARQDPENEALRPLVGGPKLEQAAKPAHTSLIVHGTWAANGTWWPPGGDFHSYLAGWVADLYALSDAYFWSGAWSDGERRAAATQLFDWAAARTSDCLNVWAHSHGGNVVFLASVGVNRAPMEFGRAVLLSVPVHRNRYWPDFDRFESLAAVRARMDLVVMADLGGQKFDDPRIEDLPLTVWFDHSASHEEAEWISHGLQFRLPVEVCVP